MATDLKPLRAALLKKLDIGDRRLQQLISAKQAATLLPRRLAILALAAEHSIPVHRYASDSDLSQLRGVANSTEPTVTRVAPAEPDPKSKSHAIARGSSRQKTKPPTGPRAARRGRKVFVVHGRNRALRNAMFSFLRSLSLEPMEWQKGIAATGQGTPPVDQIVDALFRQAVAIVVLFTPDDDVILKAEFRKHDDAPYEAQLVGQARPNVLFEAGMAFARHPRETVMVQVGEVKHFSDIGGRHLTRLTNSAESRRELVTKLKNAGCDVDDAGIDWLREGNFQIKKVRARAKK
jgi:predicted nucleotide-binding protein